MANDFSVDNLTDLGLPPYEARICMALLERKRLAAKEVSNIAGVPRTRVYDSLKCTNQDLT